MEILLWIAIIALFVKVNSHENELEVHRNGLDSLEASGNKALKEANEKITTLTDELDAIKLRLRVKGK